MSSAAPESRGVMAKAVMASVLRAQPGLLQLVLSGDEEAADALAFRMLEHMHFTDVHDAVLWERSKQHAKGYDAANDDMWTLGQLITGARCYLDVAFVQTNNPKPVPPCFTHKDWPWDKSTFKPERDPVNRKVNLLKAVAMLVAELERIEREEARAR